MEISIIVPVYNKEEYIEPCLRNLLRQEFDSYEIICVDDGSTDRSGDICEQVAASTDKVVRVFHQKNDGVTSARRLGVEKSEGRYIVFVDADDGLLPDALRSLYVAIEKNGADEVIGTFITHKHYHSPRLYDGFVEPTDLIKTIITGKNQFPVLWGIIFRRDILDGTLDTHPWIVEGEDKMAQVKVLMKRPKVYFIPNTIYRYTLGVPNNRPHSLERERLYDNILREVLSPMWEEMESSYILHQVKEYESFVLERKYGVKGYYRQCIKELPKDLPLYHRIAYNLPPKMARHFIEFYKMALNYKKHNL